MHSACTVYACMPEAMAQRKANTLFGSMNFEGGVNSTGRQGFKPYPGRFALPQKAAQLASTAPQACKILQQGVTQFSHTTLEVVRFCVLLTPNYTL